VNAEAHVSQNFLLRMDFANFFPSIKDQDVRLLLRNNMSGQHFSSLETADVDAIARIVCRNGELTIGAPSSPSISNAALYHFDQRILDKCSELGVVYTRYADDLTFSTNEPQTLKSIHQFVRETVARTLSPRLTVNDEKTVFTSKKRHRSVTGLVLTPTNQISIGRDQKRTVKALCHKYKHSKLPLGQASYLRGYLAFVSSVEPRFIESLKAKYGAELIQTILGETPVRRKPF
jgi:RNA-directed DNA polymerase